MKLAVYDSWNGKFTTPIIEHWRELGHEVRVNGTWDDLREADRTLFYPADNGIITASTQKLPHKGKIYVACIDIEVWAGQPMAVDWTYVDGLTFIAQHIHDYVMERIIPPKLVRVIKPGIDLDKFKLRENFTNNTPVKKIAYVVGDKRIWDVKRFDVALMLLRDLLDSTKDIWQLHILGSYSTHVQYNSYCDHLIKELELEGFLFWYPRQEAVQSWLGDKSYLILPSTKEAFSYATAEAMAVGIKPILGNWESAKETWGPYYNKTHGQMFRRLIEKDYTPEVYRKFVSDRYDQKRYFAELDEFMEIGGDSHV